MLLFFLARSIPSSFCEIRFFLLAFVRTLQLAVTSTLSTVEFWFEHIHFLLAPLVGFGGTSPQTFPCNVVQSVLAAKCLFFYSLIFKEAKPLALAYPMPLPWCMCWCDRCMESCWKKWARKPAWQLLDNYIPAGNEFQNGYYRFGKGKSMKILGKASILGF